MLNRATNRVRPILEALESREVYAASLTASAMTSILPAVNAGQMGLLSAAGKASGLNGKPTPQLHVAYSVISIQNETSQAMRFTFRWEGDSAATTYVLLPGHTRQFSIRQVELFRELTATVQFAQIAASANLSQPYQLTSELLPASANGKTPSGAGQLYTIQPTNGGVGLFPD
jgi:hypothetical protein